MAFLIRFCDGLQGINRVCFFLFGHTPLEWLHTPQKGCHCVCVCVRVCMHAAADLLHADRVRTYMHVGVCATVDLLHADRVRMYMHLSALQTPCMLIVCAYTCMCVCAALDFLHADRVRMCMPNLNPIKLCMHVGAQL